MSVEHPERIRRDQRLRVSADFARLKAEGRPFRGPLCVLVTLAVPGERTRVAFIASRRSVGGAVQRNRARRRMREVVRRRWPRVNREGLLILFVASRRVLTAPAPELSAEIERLLLASGAMASEGR
jgi:ribonuclease P protein component